MASDSDLYSVSLRIADEIKLLEGLKERLGSCLEELSHDDSISPEEKTRLRTEGYKLMDMTQKALLYRKIITKIESLNMEHILLTALNEKFLELSRIMAEFSSSKFKGLSNKYEALSPIYNKPELGNQLFEELRKIREEIYRALASEGEEDSKK